MTIASTLKAIHVEYASIWPGWAKKRFHPASESEITDFEGELGRRLPDDFRQFLAMNDTEHAFDGNYACSPLTPQPGFAGVAGDWRHWKQLLDAGTFDDGRFETHRANGNWDDGKIQTVWWSAGWIPFAKDGCGNAFCVDLSPGPNGAVGQVMTMEVQGAMGPFATDHASFEAFLEAHLALLVNGQYDLEQDGDFLTPSRYNDPRPRP